jgi:hypothetical protein
MKNSEEAIEKVLAGLRDAEAPAGMERRILNALEERAAVRCGLGWPWLGRVWAVTAAPPIAVGSLVCGVALAGIFAVALAIPVIRRLGHATAGARRSSALVGSVGSVGLGASEVGAKSAQPALSRSGLRSLRKMTAEGRTNAGSAEAVLDSDAAALEEMHAPSRPAPPMPLTEQERLLLRLVHKDDPVELAMLDSKLRALEDLKDKAEFQSFFGQSRKQATPEPSMTEPALPQQSTTEQVAPGQPGTEGPTSEQPVPEQPVPDQPMTEQPTQPQSTPEKIGTDQSTTQQITPRPTRTGENQ